MGAGFTPVTSLGGCMLKHNLVFKVSWVAQEGEISGKGNQVTIRYSP